MITLRKWQSKVLKDVWAARPNYKKAVRSIVLAAPGAGKSTFAAAVAARTIQVGGRIAIAYTFSYLDDNFREALAALGVPDNAISSFSAGTKAVYDPARPIQLISLQTLESRLGTDAADMLSAFGNYRYCIIDECHTAMNFRAALDLSKVCNFGHIIGMTGTYFQGSLSIDERRNYGGYIARADQGRVYNAGTYEEMVKNGVLRPIRYIRLKQKDSDVYSQETIENAVDEFIAGNPKKDGGWFFVAKRRNDVVPIEIAAEVLKSRGIEPVVMDKDSNDDEIAEAKSKVGYGKPAAFLSVDFGAVGFDHRPCHTVVLICRHHASPNTLYQKVGRVIRSDKRGLVATVIDVGCNFASGDIRGHLSLEDAIREVCENPEALFTPIYKGASVAQPPVTERDIVKRPVGGTEYTGSISSQAVDRYVNGGLGGVKELYRLLKMDNPTPQATMRQILTNRGKPNVEFYMQQLR